MKYLTAIFLALCLVTPTTWAVDKDDKFAAKGAGRKTCSQFLKAKEELSRDYLLYGGWLEGFISAYNQFQRETYDITPWQATETLINLVAHQCKDNPQTRLLNVTNSILASLYPARLKQESLVVKIDVMNHQTYFYSDVIKLVKLRLSQLGFYKGETNSDTYGIKEIEAMKNYQQKSGLRQTGIPDQPALVTLFLRARKSN